MRKILNTVALTLGILGSSQAYAFDLVLDVTNLVQSTMTAAATAATKVSAAATAISTELTAATVELQAAYDKVAHSEVVTKWVEAYKHATEISDKATSLITGVRNAGSISTLVSSKTSPGLNVDYKYAPLLPRYYTPTFTCDSAGCTTATNDGYAGNATQMTSKQIREDWKVNPTILGNNIKTISNEAAENNAQEIAVIQAMAQEAYTQANNRIDTIGKLQNAIDNPLDANKNDAKYIADLQARIQTEQALLVNEQNKLAALAILQQSQRDAYEQRKREIAAYVVNGGVAGGGGVAGSGGTVGAAVSTTLQRGLIAAAQSAAYAAVVASYQ